MQLIVTRPAAQADTWVQALRTLGLQATALPLIDIQALADPAPVQAAWRTLPGCRLVMFVSANAVAHFFAQRPADAAWPTGLRAGSTGPGTSAALRDAGLPAAAVVAPPEGAERYDSEALWAQLAHEDWAGAQVLVVRGEEGRDWFADTLRGRGAGLHFVAAYARRAPQPDAAAQALLAQALAEPEQHLWLFSSSEAVGHLRTLAPHADWSRSRAVASHPRIAQAAREAGFVRVDLVAPTPAAVAALLAPGGACGPGPSIQSAAQ